MRDVLPKSVQTLADLFLHRCQQPMEGVAYAFVRDTLELDGELSWRELRKRVMQLSQVLRSRTAPGERLLLLYPPGLDVVVAFWACIYAGLIPIPAPPPDSIRRKHSLPRLRAIMDDAHASLVLTTALIHALCSGVVMEGEPEASRWLITDDLPAETLADEPPRSSGVSLAYLQYTSGSTAAPRGVMISHRNVLTQCEGIRSAAGVEGQSRSLCWLPYYHDYGLVHGILAPFYAGIPAFLMSPLTFLRRPLRWLEAVDRFEITHSGAPNFAYDACLNALQQQAKWSGELDCWKVASCGAEPIRAETIEAFSRQFHAYGFDPRAFTPAYGLAESTLVVTTKPYGAEPVVLAVSAEALARQCIEIQDPSTTGVRRLVGCGAPLPGTAIRIVDPLTMSASSPDRIGEIWVSSQSVAEGYWARREESESAFHVSMQGDAEARYLRTGDLGFLDTDQLYVTGRLKDLIILYGRNLYPHDIEQTVERCHPAFRASGGAAFSVDNGTGEELVVVQEVTRLNSMDIDLAIGGIRQCVLDEHLVAVAVVVLVRTGGLPKTASGKVQRHLAKAAYLEGALPVVRMSRAGTAGKMALIAGASEPVALPSGFPHDRPSMEAYLKSVMLAVLQIEVEPSDLARPIAALGIDSLKAGMIKTRLEEDLMVEVSFGRLLTGGSLEDLADHLLFAVSSRAVDSSGMAAPPPHAVRNTVAASYSLSPSQLRFWFAAQLQPQSTVNTIAVAVRLEGELDAGVFESCLQALVNRHEQLRSTFEDRHGEPYQVVQSTMVVALRREALNDLPAIQRERALNDLIQRESHHRFDVAKGPLLHAVLIHVEEEVAVLLLVCHHLIVDGWSMRLLCRELTVRYRAAMVGESIALPAIQSHYHDYVAWHQSWLSAGGRERQLAYWRRQLRNVPPAPILRIDPSKRPLAPGRTGRVAEFLSSDTVAKIDAFCRERGLTRFVLLCGVYVAVLGRYAGHREMTIGAPVANRHRASAESLVGCLVNTVALRFALSDDLSMDDLLSAVHCVVMEAADHQDVPYDEVVRAITAQRGGQSRPLFNAMMVFDDQPLDDLCLVGVSAKRLSVPPTDLPVELVLLVSQRSEGLKLSLEYHSGRYASDGMGRLLGDIHKLLDRCLANSSLRLSAHWHGPDQEVVRGKESQPVAAVTVPDYESVLQRFHEQVGLRPAACAVATQQEMMTYEELDRRSNQVAHYLHGKGVRRGTLVGVCCERSIGLAVVLLGIWKAGGAYVPLDPTLPRDRLSSMIGGSMLSVLVTQLALRPRLPAFEGIVIDLDLEGAELLGCDDAPCPPVVGRDDLAYLMYTSGSTGTPKGVAVTHGNVAESTRAREVYYRHPVERFLFTSSLAFDSSVIGLYWTWCTGGELVIPAEDQQGDPDALLGLVARHRITHVAWGPSLYARLLQKKAPSGGESLRVVIVGGEVLPVELVRQHYELLPHALLYNEYGPTEATVWSVVHQASVQDGGARVPIGRAIAGTHVFLLDEQRHPVSTGQIGEIYIGGGGVAQGYWNDSVLTAASFLRRCDGQPGFMYKTGDLGVRRTDGLFEFVGRRDRQIKLRGYRIELEDIESVLRGVPGVSDAAVLCRDSPAREAALVAYLRPQQGVTLVVGDVWDALRLRLPSYMVPSSVVLLPVFPYTASGKVDRLALPAPDAASFSRESAPVAPRDHIEQGLMQMWTQLLGVPVPGIHAQFFELGGHSLLATQVVSQMREVFGVELSLRTFFERPTIAALGEAVRDAQRRDHGQPKLSSIHIADRSQPLPLSSSQQRMWVLHQLAPQSTAYNMLFVSRQIGRLSRQALRQAVTALAARHESFRTTFAMSDAGPVQRVSSSFDVPWGEVDLSQLPLAQRLVEGKRLAEEEARRPFNLESGPLARFLLIQLDAEDHLLVLTMHHIISDQWSFGIIGRECAMYYNAYIREQELHVDPLPIQYVDFAAWEQGCLHDARLVLQGEYWARQLTGLMPLSLPTDFPRPAVQTFDGSSCSMDLSASLISRVEEFSAAQRATPFMTMLACFHLLLSRYSGSMDIAVGSPIANRTHASIEGLIGTFVNTLVLRLDLSGDPTFAECVARVRELALGAYANQEFPFEKLVERVHATRDPSYGPLVQVLFNVGNAPVGDVDLHGLTWVPFEADAGAAQFDVSLTVETVFSRKARLTFNKDLFDRATAERMLMHYRVLLHQAVTAPDRRCSTLRLLTPAEESLMVYGWNETSETYPVQACVFEMIEAQVERTPEAVALSMDGQTLTYREMNAQANQFARRLFTLGVHPAHTVGLCFDRSFEMVIAVLAVWKAGAHYVPLDPEYPRERIRFMLEDSGAAVVLTTTDLSDRVFMSGAQVVCVDQERSAIEQEASHNLPRSVTAEDLAYVLYTSGSTGQPKGVEIAHRALVNFLCSMRQRPGCAANDVLLAVTTLSFDIAGLELYLPLIVGGRVEIASRAVATDGGKLRDRLDAVGATIMQATPATWRLLLRAGWAGRSSLTALCGGEAFPSDLAAQLLTRTRAVWNMYGPTETTIWSTVSKLEPSDKEITIGRPIGNTTIYILDERRTPVPVGVPGELYIGGHGLARGYRKRPDLTAERFLADPFSCEPQARMYRTGDRAQYRADGAIIHLGRLDHQVKIRGFRIELGEIEAVLSRHQAVRQVIVTAREDESGEKYLAAYVVQAPDQTVDPNALRMWVRAVLPEYMVPTAYMFLESFPLTANNKVDVRALPAPHAGVAAIGRGRVAPRNLIEVQLAALWQQVLGVPEIGVHENFFDLGGHSLKAAQLFYLLGQVYGRSLPLATLFHAPTIAGLAEVLTREQWTPPWQSLVAIQPQGSLPPLFIVPGVGGNILIFAQLAKCLGVDQPVYGLQAQGLDGKDVPFTRVPAMAAHYVSEIRRFQPAGPYVIAGACTGGLIAYEIAQQLGAQGHRVKLAMLDTWHPISYRRYRSRWRTGIGSLAAFLKWGKSEVRALWDVPFRRWGAYCASKVAAVWGPSNPNVVHAAVDTEYQVERVTTATFSAVAHYEVKPYQGSVLNCIASERPVGEAVVDTRYGWARAAGAGSDTVYVAAADSGRLFVAPHVERLADAIRAYVPSVLEPAAPQAREQAAAGDGSVSAERRVQDE